MKRHLTFNIPLPKSSEGFARRQCAKVECHKVFQIPASESPESIYCPYCGELGSIADTHAETDLNYSKKVLEEKAIKHAHDEAAKMFKSVFGKPGSGFKFTPGQPYREKRITPPRVPEKLDTDIECPECQFRFKVYGIFGYCPKCRAESIQIYDASISVIRAEIARAPNKQRELRQAYGDLVSGLEAFFKKKDIGEKRRNNWFQSLTNLENCTLERTGVGIGQTLSTDEYQALRAVLQKRHCLTHSGGIVDEELAHKLPEVELKIGSTVPLSADEFELAAKATSKLISANFVK